MALATKDFDKLGGAMSAIDDCWRYLFNTFVKFVKVCVIGKGDGVIRAQPPAPSWINRPTGDGNGDRSAKTGKACAALASRRSHHNGIVGG